MKSYLIQNTESNSQNRLGLRIGLVGTIVAMFVTGCSSPFGGSTYLHPAHENQDISLTYAEGREVYTSVKPHSKVALSYYGGGLYPGFTLVLNNNTSEQINFGTDQVAVFFEGDPLHVYTFEEYDNKLKGRAKSAVVGGVLAAIAIGAFGDSDTYHSGDYSWEYPTWETEFFSGLALAAGVADSSAISEEIPLAAASYLQKQTIRGHEWYSGTFFIEKTPKKGKVDGALDLFIFVNDEEHHIPLWYTPN